MTKHKVRTGGSAANGGMRLLSLKKNGALISMVTPGFIMTLLFSYLPLFGLMLAFKKINLREGILSSPWVGLDNFKFMLNSSGMWDAVRNTLLYNIVFIFIGLVMNVALAIMLSLIKSKLAAKTYQTVLIMPHFLSWVVVSYLLFGFLSMENGYLNRTVLPIFGLSEINWYYTPGVWPAILIIAYFWKNWGFNSIIYSSAIAGIDMEMYEAAKIDGANVFKQIIYITIPSLKPMITILTILSVGSIFSADMGLFYQLPLNVSQLYPATSVVNTYVYNLMTDAGSLSMGMSAAASFVQSVVGFILVVTTNAIVKKLDPERAMF